jgi:hypothetical protein
MRHAADATRERSPLGIAASARTKMRTVRKSSAGGGTRW